MDKWQHYKRKALAQNFLKDPALARRLVKIADIGPIDFVCEIGAGLGIITGELARVAKKVVAIEKDPRLACTLRRRFAKQQHIEIVTKDFLEYSMPRDVEFKIFGNIPYNVTASIMRKVIDARPAPSEAFLVMQKEASWKFTGQKGETLFSLLAKPFFELRTIHRFRRTDFHPVPNVDSVMLAVGHRRHPLLSRDDFPIYREFVKYGFGRWRPHLRAAFKNVFTYKQWKHLSRELKFGLNVTPSQLTFEQWLGLFRGYKRMFVDR